MNVPASALRKPGNPLHLFQKALANATIPVAIVVLCIGFSLYEPRFLSLDNGLNILRQASFLILITLAQVVVLITRGFDLSVGDVVSLVSVVSSIAMVSMSDAGAVDGAMPVFAGFVVAVCVASLVGFVNGFCVAFLKVAPFVVTLGTQCICLGLATTLSGGVPVAGLPENFVNWFSNPNWLWGVPPPVAVTVLFIAGVFVLLNNTTLGRSLYLIGSNPRAAHVAGLPVRWRLLGAYVICSSIVAVAAFLLTARTGSGEPNLGGGLMLQSIAAAVIGGVSLRGGEGRVMQAVNGALFITVLTVGMNFLRISGYTQTVVLGVVVIVAILLDRPRTRLR